MTANTAPLVRILIADDHPVFRMGLVQIVRADSQFELVAEAGDGAAAWELIQTHLTTHSNQWPRGISDLQVAVTNMGRGAHWHVNDLPNRIAINWNVDPEALLASAKTQASHPLLVTRRDGKPINPVWGKDMEPNLRLEWILGLPTGFLRATN